MKQLLDIIEGLKVNSKTKISNTELNINFNYDDCLFNNSDLDKIFKFIEKLSILPVTIVLSDNGKSIVLKYNYKQNKKDDFDKEGEFVRIFFIAKAGGYQIGFRKTLFDNVILYPSSNTHYNNIEVCFDLIKKHWNDWKQYILS